MIAVEQGFSMNMQQAIAAVTERQDLSQAQMQAVMNLIMTGEATQAQIGGFLVGLRMKGETVASMHTSNGRRPPHILAESMTDTTTR